MDAENLFKLIKRAIPDCKAKSLYEATKNCDEFNLGVLIREARIDALEEAAMVADKLWRGNRHQLPYDEGIDDASEKIARAIRALKEKE